MEVSDQDIKTLHSVPGHYVILPGHEIPDVEQVVQEAATYTIVKQDGALPSQ